MRYTTVAIALIGLLALPAATLAQTTVETPQAAPYLVVSKLPAVAEAQPGQLVLFTVTVKNEGSEVAKALKLNDVLPAGFTFKENGKDVLDRTFLNDLHPGEKFSASYEVVVGKDVEAGTYENRATVTAGNHGAVVANSSIIVSIPRVLGEAVSKQLKSLVGEAKPTEGTVLGEELPATGTPTSTVIALAIAFGLLVLGGAIIEIARNRAKGNQ